MQIIKTSFSFIAIILLAAGCSKDSGEDIDTEYPVINMEGPNAFPGQCSTVKRGESFVFSAELSDNRELGSVGIDIHHNFDHHTHSTETENCGLDPVKTPVKPYVLIQTYPLQNGLKSYSIQQQIAIPADIDPGDYHFMVRLTDKEGWQTIKRLSIKIN